MSLFLWMIRSSKKELYLVCGVILFLFFAPVVVVVSAIDITSLDENPVYTGPIDIRNGYEFGNCTYWAAMRRMQTGNPIPNTWGNANTWDDRARLDGYRVDHTPSIGAIMETDSGYYGHVAFVEDVDEFGNWTITEMNVVGFNQIDQRTLAAASARFYNFIH